MAAERASGSRGAEVQLRVGVRAGNVRGRCALPRVGAIGAAGAAGASRFAGGRPAVEEVVAYWPALIDRREMSRTWTAEILSA